MSEEYQEPRNFGPIVEDLDVNTSWDTESQRDLVIDRLKELGLYSPELLYRGFDAKNIESMIGSGKDAAGVKYIWCSTENDLADSMSTQQSAIFYAITAENPAIAIYDKTKLEEHAIQYKYYPKEGQSFRDALVAVFKLVNF